jgi:PAS domain S-box-containing protein
MVGGSIYKNIEIWIVFSLLLGITVIFILSFPIFDEFDWLNILSEGAIFLSILGGYLFIIRYKIIILNVGWIIFTLSIFFDLLDEFFVLTEFLSRSIGQMFTPIGLLIAMFGFFKLAKKTKWERNERIMANEALRKSENQYKDLVEKSGVAILIDDVDGNIKYCNEQFADMFGFSTKEMMQTTIQSLIHHDDIERVMKLHIDRMQGKKRQSVYEFKGIRKDGLIVHVEVHTSLVKETDKIIGTRSYISDITKRKKEEILEHVLYKISDAASVSRDLNQLYKSIHSQLGKVIDATNFYIALIDEKKALMHFPYFVDEVDYPPGPARLKNTISEYLIKSDKSLYLKEKDIQNLIDKKIVDSVATGPISKVWLGAPLRIGKKTIGVICVQSYDNPDLYNKSDLEILDFVSDQIAIAIERNQAYEFTKNSEKEYRRLSQELADSNSMKEILLDVISHDLRNPINTLMGFSELLLEKYPESEELAVMEQSSKDLLRVIDTANVLSKSAVGEEIDMEVLNISQMLNNVTDEYEFRLKDTGIEIIKEIDASLQINANPIIEEVFKNYISNAIQYAGDGKKIILRTIKEKDFIFVNVEDFGKTISKNKRELIFLRNVHLGKSKRKGRGLGLSIVKRIANAHKAEVGVKPNKPTGNIFFIKLPL